MPSWSFSSLSSAMSCLQKYKFEYIDNVKRDDTDADLKFGTAMHLGLNASLCDEDAAQIFSLFWEQEKALNLNYDRYSWDDFHNMGLNFLSKFERLHKKDFIPAIMEKRLYSEYRGVRLEGTVDFAGMYKGVPSIVDFKTTAWPYHPDKATVSLQLLLYSYLCAKAEGYKAQQVVYFPFVKGTGSIQKPLCIPISEKMVHTALDGLYEYAKMYEERQSWPKNYNSCIIGKKRCQFFDRCHKETEDGA